VVFVMTDTFEEACKKADEKTADLGAELAAKLDQQRKEQEAEAKLRGLAALTPVSYDQGRQQAAKELGVRATTLDREVARLRRRPEPKPPTSTTELMEGDLKKAAGALISDPDILSRFDRAVQDCGLIGEVSNAKIIFLALTSRLFDLPDRPVSIAVKGVSSGGKSYTVETVLKFFPQEAYFARTGMSEHALPYSHENFKNRFIVIYEAVGMHSEAGSYFLGSLLSENQISYETVEKDENGALRARVMTKEGPTGLIVTTTQNLHAENETRILSLGVIDSPEQTKAVMASLGDRAANGTAAAAGLEQWQAFQRWLALGERRVVIPYAPAIAALIPPLAVRLRRDFTTLISLIKAHALLHRNNRTVDKDGRIVATVADYAAVRGLLVKLLAEGVEATVPPTVRETVVAVGGVGEVSITGLARILKLDKNSVHHRVRKAIERGYLVNREEKRGMPARIAIADPLPDEFEILPPVEALDCWSVGTPMEGVKARGGEEGEGPEAGSSTPPFLPPDQHSNTPTLTPGRTCACCGRASPILNAVSVDGLTVPLHPSCEAAYLARLDLRRPIMTGEQRAKAEDAAVPAE
jgi:hypothetical protein